MPVYGYRCKSCNHTFEVMQSINDEPIKDCPNCKGEVSKIFFPVGISFKGSGFYVTDYKSPNGKKEKSTAKNVGNGETKQDNGSKCSSCATTTLGSE
ncbi:MAG: hypothetical protein K6T91_06005 [Firmicutes bacterium]|nr:hypothetical protein [Bacillota bacterium]